MKLNFCFGNFFKDAEINPVIDVPEIENNISDFDFYPVENIFFQPTGETSAYFCYAVSIVFVMDMKPPTPNRKRNMFPQAGMKLLFSSTVSPVR